MPEGYRQVVTGDIEFIYGQHYEILIEKDTAIVNIRFIDRDGNFTAGGDYFVPLADRKPFIVFTGYSMYRKDIVRQLLEILSLWPVENMRLS